MSPELGMQLADIGLKAIDGLGNMWADKYHREKKKKELREINELREAYAERINGPGSGGGTASGHLGEVNYLNYFMPAIQSVATTGYYQLANHVGNKAYEAYLKNRHPAEEESLVERPEPSGDAKTEDLAQTVANANVGIIASNDQQGLFQTLGMSQTTNPVGMTSQTSYLAGLDPKTLKLFGQTVFAGDNLNLLRKGAKLIPRQK